MSKLSAAGSRVVSSGFPPAAAGAGSRRSGSSSLSSTISSSSLEEMSRSGSITSTQDRQEAAAKRRAEIAAEEKEKTAESERKLSRRQTAAQQNKTEQTSVVASAARMRRENSLTRVAAEQKVIAAGGADAFVGNAQNVFGAVERTAATQSNILRAAGSLSQPRSLSQVASGIAKPTPTRGRRGVDSTPPQPSQPVESQPVAPQVASVLQPQVAAQEVVGEEFIAAPVSQVAAQVATAENQGSNPFDTSIDADIEELGLEPSGLDEVVENEVVENAAQTPQVSSVETTVPALAEEENESSEVSNSSLVRSVGSLIAQAGAGVETQETNEAAAELVALLSDESSIDDTPILAGDENAENVEQISQASEEVTKQIGGEESSQPEVTAAEEVEERAEEPSEASEEGEEAAEGLPEISAPLSQASKELSTSETFLWDPIYAKGKFAEAKNVTERIEQGQPIIEQKHRLEGLIKGYGFNEHPSVDTATQIYFSALQAVIGTAKGSIRSEAIDNSQDREKISKALEVVERNFQPLGEGKDAIKTKDQAYAATIRAIEGVKTGIDQEFLPVINRAFSEFSAVMSLPQNEVVQEVPDVAPVLEAEQEEKGKEDAEQSTSTQSHLSGVEQVLSNPEVLKQVGIDEERAAQLRGALRSGGEKFTKTSSEAKIVFWSNPEEASQAFAQSKDALRGGITPEEKVEIIGALAESCEDSAFKLYAKIASSVIEAEGSTEEHKRAALKNLQEQFSFLGSKEPRDGNESANKAVEAWRETFSAADPSLKPTIAKAFEDFSAEVSKQSQAALVQDDEEQEEEKGKKGKKGKDPQAASGSSSEVDDDDKSRANWKQGAIVLGKGATAIALAAAFPGFGFVLAIAFLIATKNIGADKKGPEMEKGNYVPASRQSVSEPELDSVQQEMQKIDNTPSPLEASAARSGAENDDEEIEGEEKKKTEEVTKSESETSRVDARPQVEPLPLASSPKVETPPVMPELAPAAVPARQVPTSVSAAAAPEITPVAAEIPALTTSHSLGHTAVGVAAGAVVGSEKAELTNQVNKLANLQLVLNVSQAELGLSRDNAQEDAALEAAALAQSGTSLGASAVNPNSQSNPSATSKAQQGVEQNEAETVPAIQQQSSQGFGAEEDDPASVTAIHSGEVIASHNDGYKSTLSQQDLEGVRAALVEVSLDNVGEDEVVKSGVASNGHPSSSQAVQAI